MIHRPLLATALLSVAVFAASQTAFAEDPSAGDGTAVLAPIVVSGEQPGPGLWRVSRDGHELWILGSLSPLPKKMTWLSREVEETIARSQEVILPASVSFDVAGGRLTGLFLLPSLLGARNNPGKQKLADVVPAELHARWLVLKQKYLGRDAGIEKRRPLLAASELYDAAIRSAGLSTDSPIDPVVKRAAKKNDVPVTRPKIELEVANPRATVKEFARTPLDDIECLQKTIERLEADLTVMQLRANAWASGDIEALTGLTHVDQNKACRDALLRSTLAEQRGMDDLPERVANLWIEAADRALASHATSFAILPIDRLLESGGYLDRLRARGYVVEAP